MGKLGYCDCKAKSREAYFLPASGWVNCTHANSVYIFKTFHLLADYIDLILGKLGFTAVLFHVNLILLGYGRIRNQFV